MPNNTSLISSKSLINELAILDVSNLQSKKEMQSKNFLLVEKDGIYSVQFRYFHRQLRLTLVQELCLDMPVSSSKKRKIKRKAKRKIKKFLKKTYYHNGLEWLWIGCVDAVSKHTSGLKKEAEEIVTKLASKILEFNGVYEVYQLGKPVKRLFYNSESYFAWSSGLFVWACKELDLI